jgi:hypothetical protein
LTGALVRTAIDTVPETVPPFAGEVIATPPVGVGVGAGVEVRVGVGVGLLNTRTVRAEVPIIWLAES